MINSFRNVLIASIISGETMAARLKVPGSVTFQEYLRLEFTSKISAACQYLTL